MISDANRPRQQRVPIEKIFEAKQMMSSACYKLYIASGKLVCLAVSLVLLLQLVEVAAEPLVSTCTTPVSADQVSEGLMSEAVVVSAASGKFYGASGNDFLKNGSDRDDFFIGSGSRESWFAKDASTATPARTFRDEHFANGGLSMKRNSNASAASLSTRDVYIFGQ